MAFSAVPLSLRVSTDRLPAIQKALEAPKDLKVFPYSNDLPEDRTMEWEGNDPAEFLEMARGLGEGVLYVRVGKVDSGEDREGWKEHRGELAFIEVAFVRGGLYHVKTWPSDWLAEVPTLEGVASEDETASDFEGIHRIGGLEPTPETRKFLERFTREGASHVDEYLSQAAKLRPPPEPTGYRTRDALLNFYQRKLGSPGGYFSRSWIEADENARTVWQDAISRVEKALIAREQREVTELLPVCAEWARTQTLKAPSLTDIEVFLADKGNPLSTWGRKELWRRVKLLLKTQ